MIKLYSIFELSELIARSIRGKISGSEKKTLDDWLDASGQNQELYRKISDKNNSREWKDIYDSFDVEVGWSNVSGQLFQQNKRSILPIFLKYVAILLIPIFTGITLFYHVNNHAQNDPLIAKIQPGSSEAVLLMADGKAVDLSQCAKENLIEDDGTVINNNQKELNYTGESAQKAGKKLMNTLVVPKGGEYTLVLSDGTRVFVNSMSKLIFPVRFTGKTREVALEGEAYFEVAKDPSKPFIVTAKGAQVKVLGTSFNIKAYPKDCRTFTTLVEGKVKIRPSHLKCGTCVLRPNQQAVFDPSTNKIDVREVDASHITQWITGRYYFDNQSLDEIMKTLSRWYDFNYRFEDESLKDLRFVGGLNKYESIKPILDIIAKTRKVHISVSGKEIKFSKI